MPQREGAVRVHRGCRSTTCGDALPNLTLPGPDAAQGRSSCFGAVGRQEGVALVGEPTEERSESDVPVPELRPWCEVGWIFKNGDAVAVERLRPAHVSRQRDE
jgi:hypothetical protein